MTITNACLLYQCSNHLLKNLYWHCTEAVVVVVAVAAVVVVVVAVVVIVVVAVLAVVVAAAVVVVVVVAVVVVVVVAVVVVVVLVVAVVVAVRKIRRIKLFINPLTPNDPCSGHTAPLTSKLAFYIFIQQI